MDSPSVRAPSVRTARVVPAQSWSSRFFRAASRFFAPARPEAPAPDAGFRLSDVRVVRRAEALVAGLCIATDLAHAPQDCPALWQWGLEPRRGELPDGDGCAYGLAWITNPATGAMHYWAGMPVADRSLVPPSMDAVVMPGGRYAECVLEDAEDIPRGYAYLLRRWLPEHPHYTLNTEAPYAEWYAPDYTASNRVVLYLPVRFA